MTRHDTHHDQLKQEVAQTQASLKSFKQVRRDKREKDTDTDGLNPENPQTNRFY